MFGALTQQLHVNKKVYVQLWSRCDLHTKVGDTAGNKRIGVNVFMTWQKWKEEKCAAFLYGVLRVFIEKKNARNESTG